MWRHAHFAAFDNLNMAISTCQLTCELRAIVRGWEKQFHCENQRKERHCGRSAEVCVRRTGMQ
jgi:hypothetical protein